MTLKSIRRNQVSQQGKPEVRAEAKTNTRTDRGEVRGATEMDPYMVAE